MNLTGKIERIGLTTTVSESFQKRELVIEYAENPTYPEHIKMELVQDKCDIADGFKIGDIVEVDFNLRGRFYTPKNGGPENVFNSIVIWKMKKAEEGSYAPPKDAKTPNGEDDDLPF